MKFVTVLACVLLSSQCGSLPVEDSVVSVYTTQPTTAGTPPTLDVYHQIANNIAERITSPIYKFLGINSTTIPSTTRLGTLELTEERATETKTNTTPINNDIATDRDVEDLSVESLQKQDKKPEKITLYSSKTPFFTSARQETAQKGKPKDLDDIDFDDEEPATKREGPFVFFMEMIGSLIQLILGGISSLFNPPSS